MTKFDNIDRPWAAFGWAVLAFLMFCIGAVCLLNAAILHFPHWLCADRYVPAELEVMRLHPPGRGGGQAIEGVIHPGGERVWTNTRRIDVSQFVAPSEREIRRVPTRSELEGQRVAVWYWPDHASEIRWWHPATVIRPGGTQKGSVVVRDALIGVAFIFVMVFSFRRFYRCAKAAAPPDPESQATPAWVGIVIVLMYVVALGLVVYFS